MAGASIRVVANRTGIPADTLRAWERRYGFPKPARTPGGSRLYTEDDIARLVLVNRALADGYRPNEVVALPHDELERVVAAGRTNGGGVGLGMPAAHAGIATPVSVATITDALKRDDIEAVRALFRAAALTMGPKAFVTDLAHPLAVRIGQLWEEGSIEVRHEHLASACLTTTLRLLLGAHDDGPRAPLVVLATLPGEPHALPLDMIALYLASSLAAPRLLGADTPVDQIAAAASAYGADVVGISVSAAADKRSANRAALKLVRLLDDDVELWIGGEGAERIDMPDARMRKVTSWRALDDALADARRVR